MRTQAWPTPCSHSGNTARATALTMNPISFLFMWPPSSAIGHAFTQQALRAQREDEDEHSKSKDVLVVATQDAAGQNANVASPQGLDQAQQQAAHHGPAQVA